MAVINDIEPEKVRLRLESRLREIWANDEDFAVTRLDIPESGLSFQTLLFTIERQVEGRRRSERLVARVQPEDGSGVFMEYDLQKEVRVLEALRGTPVPVPRVHSYDADPQTLGAPFAVMEWVAGRTPCDSPSYMREGWVLELSPDERRRMCVNGLQVLADLHGVDWRALDLGWLARPALGATPLDEHIAWWEQAQAWGSGGTANPVVDTTLAWIKANRPDEPEAVVLTWGDAKPGNMLYADDLSVTAALDFEMVSLAAPELDLGWWLFVLRWHTQGLDNPSLPEGLLDRAAVIELYQELSGREVRHADFYEVFAGLRIAILGDRAARMMIAAGLLPPDHPATHNNQATRSLADMLGLPAPEGVSLLREFDASTA